ncbi:TRAP transporter small permease subunit [Neoroseomonas oryzicola]|uniref:TRAP transporter small permease protein n=1 Tax=Neoroseomonas oryzicola TaxID=535904 RepID=A0A9X9WGW8_9PROT|nr:TRAP transporter small permease [Neoroseomonas oryzicola]NKE16143.1 TRAP transporter small permease [Neoroseomonas oryzicola]
MNRLRSGLTAIARVAALIGGLLLLVAVGVTCASVIRGLWGRPILGDSEVVEMCLGIAVALYLPWAEMKGSHVIVDVFTARLSPRGIAWLDAGMRGCVALVATVLAVQIADGAYGQWDRERATMFLELPYWWGYAGAALGLALWTVAAFFVAAERLQEARRAA